ncbi:DUF2971 domain-containing protein [Desulfovibrio falkowii]|uniref:DUF2971 domain-containing protein n=1 Tax=Desulfovibrio sp. WGS1351 TaxID=3366814 RepID=UPI00372CF5DE
MANRKLYKYKSFNLQTLEMLICDNIYCADPTTFNDPLDTKPCIRADVSDVQLEGILRKLIEDRVYAEMQSAAFSIKYSGANTLTHITRRSQLEADSVLDEIRYEATNPQYDGHNFNPLSSLLTIRLQWELLRMYEKGVFCLAEKCDCPLMWSHYGDQHNGLCIGYRIPERAEDKIFKVSYRGAREVSASKIMAMLNSDKCAQREVDESVLLRKAGCWRYEKEWRLIGNRGPMRSPFELSEIIFGCRCPDFVKFSVISSLSQREGRIKYYEMRECAGEFRLKRYPVNICELNVCYPRDNHATQLLLTTLFGEQAEC